MIEEKAAVVEVGQDHVVFRVTGEEACESCDLSEQCYRDGGLLRISRSGLKGIPADELTTGRTVKLKMENTSLLGLTGIVYGIPLALFVCGLLIGNFLLFSQAGEAGRALGSFATGVILVAVFWLPIVRLDKKTAGRVRYRTEPLSDTENEHDYYYRTYSQEKQHDK